VKGADMKEAFEKIKERLGNIDPQEMMSEEQRNVLNYCIEIVNQVAEECKLSEKLTCSDDGWIPVSERLPKNSDNVNVTILVGDNIETATAYCDFGEWCICPKDDYEFYFDQYEVIAWQPLPTPFNPKVRRKDCNTCANNTEPDEIDNGCYMCCKGIEDNYQPNGE
jgi:hypothetical protein